MATPLFHALTLRCPGCDAPIDIDDSACAEGVSCRCGSCGAELQLTREWSDDGNRYRWILADADMEFVDDDRR